MHTVTTESKTAGAVVEDSAVPAQAGPTAEQLVTAEAIAEALDPVLVAQLAGQARAQGVQLLGRGGVLQQLTKRFLEAALEAEMDTHLGYDKHDPVGRDGGNSRNGRRSKTVLTEVGPVDIAVARDRDGSFAPTVVPKRSRRLGGSRAWWCRCRPRASRTGRSARIWPRCTARRCRRIGSPRSPIGSWTG